jgi:hypothetical protein
MAHPTALSNSFLLENSGNIIKLCKFHVLLYLELDTFHVASPTVINLGFLWHTLLSLKRF